MLHAALTAISSIPFLVGLGLVILTGLFTFWLKNNNFAATVFGVQHKWAYLFPDRGLLRDSAKLQQDNPSELKPNGLTDKEEALCSALKSAITGSKDAHVDSAAFSRAKEYLSITKQASVHPPSFWAELGLFVLVFGESVGTGYVLAPWMSTEITPSQANVAAFVLALTVAIILALLTHLAGASMAKYRRYKNNTGSDEAQHDAGILESPFPPGLHNPQSVDAYYLSKGKITATGPRQRFSSRVGDDDGSYAPFLLGVVVVMVVALMVGIFAIRAGGVESNTTRKIVSMEKNGFSGGSNPFASAVSPSLPADVQQAQLQSRKQVAESLGGDYKLQGMAASIVLSLIYLVTQFTAFFVSFVSTFSAEGKRAYENTRGMSDYNSYVRKYLMPKIHKAESLLAKLRQMRHAAGAKFSGTSSFKEYLDLDSKSARNEEEERLVDAAVDAINADDAKAIRGVVWDLSVRNFGLDENAKQQLAQKLEGGSHKPKFGHGGNGEEQLGRKIQGDSLTGQSHSAVLAPVAATREGTLGGANSRGTREEHVNVAASGDGLVSKWSFADLSERFLGLNDDNARVNFLTKCRAAMSAPEFDALRAEIKHRKEAARAVDEFKDLLGN